MARSIAILSIGSVNLKTGKCSSDYWDEVWSCWEEDATAHNMLVRLDSGKMIVTHTCGDGEKVGYESDYHHDQSGRRIGHGTVLAVEPHTKAGLAKLADVAGKKSLVMLTYK